MRIQNENDYEDLQALWADLESGLGIVLSHPDKVHEFVLRIKQYARWMQSLLAQDTDVGLFILFQLAGNSPVGYSTAHALICAVLAELTAQQLGIESKDKATLVNAALTMNVSMTALQDVLALQTTPLQPEQSQTIAQHASQSVTMLRKLGVEDALWLHLVAEHHADSHNDHFDRLLGILHAVDRYAAMISPRSSRPGRSAVESVRAIDSEIGWILIRAVGVYPPGTYVQLSSKELAVVVRRTGPNAHPEVAIISTPEGEAIATPRLHYSMRRPRIRSAVSASLVRARLKHFKILNSF